MGSPEKHRVRKKTEWTPRLKQRGARAAVPRDSVSAQTADQALANMKQIGRRRAAGCAMDEAAVAGLVGRPAVRSVIARPTAGTPRPAKGSVGLVAALGFVGVAAAALMVGGSLLGPTAYTVSGTVMFRGHPLRDAMLCFHEGGASTSSMSATTSADGRFAVASLPEGTYKITVRYLGEDDGGVPAAYARVESTKFSLAVTKDLPALTMLVESK